jgi:hypothetical protein
MTYEPGGADDGMGVSAGTVVGESARSHTHWLIERYDEDATSWASRRLGGDPAGRAGFLQPSVFDFRRLGVSPFDMSEVIGNLVTNVGWGRIARLAIGTAVTAFTTATTRIGAGVGTGAAAGNDTDLSGGAGATGRFFQPVSGAGTATDGTGTSGTGSATLAFASTFGTGDANFAWGEFGVDQGTATGTTVVAPLLNHKVSAQGTKASGQTWSATVTFTFTSS